MKILIVGAGIAGLTMARALNKHGLEATLIEKACELSAEGCGIALPANATRALDYLGLKQPLMQMSHQVKAIIYATPSGKILSQASLLEGNLNYSEFVALHRKDLINLLAFTVANIQFNCTISALNHEHEGVSVTLSNGTQDRWDLVIAADGINSSIRQHCFAHYTPKTFDIPNWRFIAHLDTQGLEPTYFLGRKTAFMIYPISQDQVYCYAQIAHYQGSSPAKQVLQQHFAHYAPMVKNLIHQVDNHDIISGQLKSVPSIAYFSHRVAFIGDASSACSPLLQQGAASACEDAICLAAMLQSYPIDTALVHYKAYREKRVSWIMNRSDKPLVSIAKHKTWLSIALRNLLIKTKGPLNIQGWQQLFQEDPIAGLPTYQKNHPTR